MLRPMCTWYVNDILGPPKLKNNDKWGVDFSEFNVKLATAKSFQFS